VKMLFNKLKTLSIKNTKYEPFQTINAIPLCMVKKQSRPPFSLKNVLSKRRTLANYPRGTSAAGSFKLEKKTLLPGKCVGGRESHVVSVTLASVASRISLSECCP